MKKIVVLALISPCLAFAQKLENQKAVIQGDLIINTYDITNTFAGDKCDIQLFSSHNNYASPLQQVSGDVGKGVLPGKGKRIEWQSKAELGNYSGEVTFEIRAEVIAVFAFKSSALNTKRGKTVPIAWRGGALGQDVKIELLKEGVTQGVLATSPNSGVFQWNVPVKQRTGGNYQIKLVNGKETVVSNYFSIKHKVPTLLKALPLVAVGAVVALAGGSKGGGGSSNGKGPTLASPPDLGLN